MNFTKTILFKEADKRLLCRFGSSMCNEKMKCDMCLKAVAEEQERKREADFQRRIKNSIK